MQVLVTQELLVDKLIHYFKLDFLPVGPKGNFFPRFLSLLRRTKIRNCFPSSEIKRFCSLVSVFDARVDF